MIKKIGLYEISKTLGYGATAEVVLGRAPDGRLVAIKVFKMTNKFNTTTQFKMK